jgi:hypothetical protein
LWILLDDFALLADFSCGIILALPKSLSYGLFKLYLHTSIERRLPGFKFRVGREFSERLNSKFDLSFQWKFQFGLSAILE